MGWIFVGKCEVIIMFERGEEYEWFLSFEIFGLRIWFCNDYLDFLYFICLCFRC